MEDLTILVKASTFYSLLKTRSSGPSQSQLAQPEPLIDKRHRGTEAQSLKTL